jgi:hypothetical protein
MSYDGVVLEEEDGAEVEPGGELGSDHVDVSV